jgi:hypothetical protein
MNLDFHLYLVDPPVANFRGVATTGFHHAAREPLVPARAF